MFRLNDAQRQGLSGLLEHRVFLAEQADQSLVRRALSLEVTDSRQREPPDGRRGQDLAIIFGHLDHRPLSSRIRNNSAAIA
jgi:hypothetical protein